MRFILIASFAASLFMSLAFTFLIRLFAPKLRLMDIPDERKPHPHPIPQGGGIGIFLSTMIVIAVISAAVISRHYIADLFSLPGDISKNMELAAETLPFLLYIFAGGALVAFLGLIDDIRPLSPSIKLVFQIAIITATVLTSGLRITLFLQIEWLQIFITIAWVVLLTNSFNLLDNMDGLSGGVSIACGFSLFLCAMLTQQFFIAGFLLCLIGAVLGFLFFNLPPASIFMGDSGSMFIGYMLGAAGVLTTFIDGPEAHIIKPIIIPLIIFALPLYDTFSVILIRISRNNPVFCGDTNHFSHRLQKAGMSRRNVLFTIILIALASSLGASVSYAPPLFSLIIPFVQVVCLILILAQIEFCK